MADFETESNNSRDSRVSDTFKEVKQLLRGMQRVPVTASNGQVTASYTLVEDSGPPKALNSIVGQQSIADILEVTRAIGPAGNQARGYVGDVPSGDFLPRTIDVNRVSSR